jgi:hypothetical protein
MTSVEDESRSGMDALKILRLLTPSTPRNEAEINTLRGTYQVARAARTPNFSSQETLDNVRVEAAIALEGVAGNWDGECLTQERIGGRKSTSESREVGKCAFGSGSHCTAAAMTTTHCLRHPFPCPSDTCKPSSAPPT